MQKSLWIIGVVLAAFHATTALAVTKDETNHPLVVPYEGSSLHNKQVKEFDAYSLFKGWNKQSKAYVTEALEGKVTKIHYKTPPGRSEIEIYHNYRAALTQAGAQILYECDQTKVECMDTYVGSLLRQRFGIQSIGNRTGHYMAAKLERDNQTAYVVIGVGPQDADVHVVEMKKMETGKSAINMEALVAGLDTQGSVVVEGIYFDTDKTTLKSESKPALEEVAALLKAKPQLTLYVVGHTDTQGAFEHNMQLSKGRAEAVVEALVKDNAIAAHRLQAQGVGPLAPVASNAEETGRAKNRRVVLVQR